jgi:hypothetical protein
LIGLDERGVIMAFHFKDCDQSTSNINDPGIFSGTLEDSRTFSGEEFKEALGAFIAAVLRPHDREDSELRVVGLPSQNL